MELRSSPRRPVASQTRREATNAVPWSFWEEMKREDPRAKCKDHPTRQMGEQEHGTTAALDDQQPVEVVTAAEVAPTSAAGVEVRLPRPRPRDRATASLWRQCGASWR